MEMVLEQLRTLGAVLIDPVEMPRDAALSNADTEVLRYEMKAGLNAYLANLGPGAPVRSLAEVIAFNERNAQAELRWFGQEELVRSQAKGPLTEPDYLEALATCRRLARTEGIDAVMNRHNLDAIVAPTSTPAHVTDWITGDNYLGDSTTPAAVAGYPSITVPAGFVSELPVGVSFFGRAWTERELVRIAWAFEQASNARRKPRFLPTLNRDSLLGN